MELFVYPKSVLLWYGTIAAIPSGFRLCDGVQGTPDLRDKFLAGAGNAYAPGNTGGGNHRHVIETDDLFLTFTTHGALDMEPAATISTNTIGHNHAGHTSVVDIRPPYKSLSWIMKL